MLVFQFNVYWVGGNWVVVILVVVIRVDVIWNFAPHLFQIKNSRPEFLKMLSHTGFSLIAELCHGDDGLLLARSDAPIMDFKKSKIPGLLTCGQLLPMVPNSSRWIHTNAVITNPTKSYSSHLSTTLHTANGYVPITMSLFINGIGQLFGADDRWVTHRIVQESPKTPKGLRSTYHEYFRPIIRFIYEQQKNRLHTYTVGVSMKLCSKMFKRIGISTTLLE